MGLHHARLNAMLDPGSLADWNLNDEDRAAIRWALDAIDSLKSERDEVRRESCEARHRAHVRTQALEEAARQLGLAVRALRS